MIPCKKGSSQQKVLTHQIKTSYENKTLSFLKGNNAQGKIKKVIIIVKYVCSVYEFSLKYAE